MTPKIDKVNLTLLKKLVGELEASLTTAESIKSSVNSDVNEYIIEMSKAAGLCAGVMSEAGMLVGDVQTMVMSVQNPASAKSDLLDKILGPLKGSGTN